MGRRVEDTGPQILQKMGSDPMLQNFCLKLPRLAA